MFNTAAWDIYLIAPYRGDNLKEKAESVLIFYGSLALHFQHRTHKKSVFEAS